jgi:hypothetical protein
MDCELDLTCAMRLSPCAAKCEHDLENQTMLYILLNMLPALYPAQISSGCVQPSTCAQCS